MWLQVYSIPKQRDFCFPCTQMPFPPHSLQLYLIFPWSLHTWLPPQSRQLNFPTHFHKQDDNDRYYDYAPYLLWDSFHACVLLTFLMNTNATTHTIFTLRSSFSMNANTSATTFSTCYSPSLMLANTTTAAFFAFWFCSIVNADSVSSACFASNMSYNCKSCLYDWGKRFVASQMGIIKMSW